MCLSPASLSSKVAGLSDSAKPNFCLSGGWWQRRGPKELNPILPEHFHCGLLSMQTPREYTGPESLHFKSNRAGGPGLFIQQIGKTGKDK